MRRRGLACSRFADYLVSLGLIRDHPRLKRTRRGGAPDRYPRADARPPAPRADEPPQRAAVERGGGAGRRRSGRVCPPERPRRSSWPGSVEEPPAHARLTGGPPADCRRRQAHYAHPRSSRGSPWATRSSGASSSSKSRADYPPPLPQLHPNRGYEVASSQLSIRYACRSSIHGARHRSACPYRLSWRSWASTRTSACFLAVLAPTRRASTGARLALRARKGDPGAIYERYPAAQQRAR